jgi:hypothetical protein
MKTIKIVCACGQHYSFDVEPVDGRLTAPVACPVCGADGTAAANVILAQSVGDPSSSVPTSGLKLHIVHSDPAVVVATPPPVHRLAPLPVVPSQHDLRWYEHVWVALPFAMVAFGGLIGGGCGGAAWAINKSVFQKTQNPVLRYVFTGIISVGAFVLWLVFAATILSQIKKFRESH